jgi:cytochrome c oxidase subunit II
MLLAFLIIGMIGVYYCNERLKGKILGDPASDHGVLIDRMLYITVAVTLIVFVITQAALFWFAYKYQESDNRKAYYYPHNNKLELIWTVIPAIVLTVLVGFGIFYWFKITGKPPGIPGQGKVDLVEVTGSQFKWEFRYPGKDGVLGKKYYRNIDGAANNPLGQLWDDPYNKDDVYSTGEPLKLVVGKPVQIVINSKDVIHDLGLVHFRMKMDAVPGTPTTMWFTPRFTTKEMKEKTGNPNFVYEISCDQMCGKGHTGMRGELEVVTQDEWNAWMATKKPQYIAAHPEPEIKMPVTADSTKKMTAAVMPPK